HPRVVPYGPITLDPAAGCFHYGQAMFEGLKAYRFPDGTLRAFRPDRHAQRLARGAARLCLPAPHPEYTQEAIFALLKVDREWAPETRGSALYVRPVLIGGGHSLGVRPAADYLFYVILSAVGPYYPDGFAPLRIWVEKEHVRATPGM